jgi:hypothetical protein
LRIEHDAKQPAIGRQHILNILLARKWVEGEIAKAHALTDRAIERSIKPKKQTRERCMCEHDRPDWRSAALSCTTARA